MASSVNRVFILGNLGADPELRYTTNQTAVATLNIATTEYRGMGPDGQKQEQTEWHRVIVWSKQAENCAKYLAKGRSVFIEGRLQTRSWDDKTTGQKRYTTEIIANNVQFIGSGASNGPRQDFGFSAPPRDYGSSMGGSMNQGYPDVPAFDQSSHSSLLPDLDHLNSPSSGEDSQQQGMRPSMNPSEIPF